MKIIEKLRARQEDIYAAKPITIAFLGDSVTQGCFEIYESGQATQGGVKCENAFGTHPRSFCFGG